MRICIGLLLSLVGTACQDADSPRKRLGKDELERTKAAYERFTGTKTKSRSAFISCPDAGVRLAFVEESAESVAEMLELDDKDLAELGLSTGPHKPAADDLATPFTRQQQPWAWRLGEVLAAAAPLIETVEWTDVDVDLGNALADYIALGPDGPDFDFSDDESQANREELGRVYEWFTGRMRDAGFRAGMMFTLDDGPFVPRFVETTTACPSEASIGVPGHGNLNICAGSGKDEGARVQGLRDETSVLWTCELPRVREQLQFDGAVEEDGPWGWHVVMTFGERVTIYLDADGRPSFYFVSW